MSLLKQSTVFSKLFLMTLTSDHISPATGKTVTVNISKAGATGAAAAGAVTEVDSTNMPGWYKVALTTADTATLGELAFHATATACDPTDFSEQVVAFDPSSATSLGLTNLDATVSSRSTFAGGAVASVTGAVASVTGAVGSVTGSVGSVAGAVASVTAPVTVGGYSTGQGPDEKVLLTPANKLATDSSNRVTTANPATGGSGPTASDFVVALMAATLQTSPTSGTVAEALAAARGSAIGKIVIDVSGSTMKTYAHDGSTILHSNTLDNPAAVTVRGA